MTTTTEELTSGWREASAQAELALLDQLPELLERTSFGCAMKVVCALNTALKIPSVDSVCLMLISDVCPDECLFGDLLSIYASDYDHFAENVDEDAITLSERKS